MKYRINCIIALLIMGLFIVSCNKEETDVSTITSFDSFGIEGLPSKIEIDEVDTTLTFDFTFSENQIFDVTVDVSSGEGSTANEDEDFSLSSHSIEIVTLEKKGSFQVTILPDYLTEGDEVVFLTLSSGTPHMLPESHVIEIVIKDVVTSDLVLEFDWEGTFEYLGDTYTICPNVDLDVYVLDAMGNDLGIYSAATGACPERLIISDWADGTYYLASNMFENGLTGTGLETLFPITVSAFKQNIFDESFVPVDVWDATEEDQTNGGNTSFKETAIVVVTGDTYEVQRPDGTIVAAGFKSPIKTSNQ